VSLPRANAAPAALVLHDVAPETQARCEALLDALAPWITPRGPMPVTLLVVPRYHGAEALSTYPAFRTWIDQRLLLGDEVILHGYAHADDRPVTGLSDWIERRVYTLEGEFARLSANEAGQLLASGLHELSACGWQSRGFVAPAWLTSPGTRVALNELGFDWFATRTGLFDLKTGHETAATSLVWSVRAAWRRQLSQIYNQRLLTKLLGPSHQSTPIRLGLHPVDVDWPQAVAFWQQALARVLEQRSGTTKSGLVAWR
jgi:predicted deacetylase